MAEFKPIDVEIDSIGDIATGMSNDLKCIWPLLGWMKSDVDELASKWENKDHDDFVASFTERYEPLEKSLSTLGQIVDALIKTAGAYQVAEQTLEAESTKI